MKRSQEELWADFNLRERNSDPGGGILYALRYKGEDLAAHRERIIKYLVDSGAEIAESKDGGMIVNCSRIAEDEIEKLTILVEELVVTNDAIFYSDSVGPSSIKDFSKMLQDSFYMDLYENGNTNLPGMFEFVNNAIPEIVSDITIAQMQNEVLSTDEFELIQELGRFAAKQADRLNKGGIMLIG